MVFYFINTNKIFKLQPLNRIVCTFYFSCFYFNGLICAAYNPTNMERLIFFFNSSILVFRMGVISNICTCKLIWSEKREGVSLEPFLKITLGPSAVFSSIIFRQIENKCVQDITRNSNHLFVNGFFTSSFQQHTTCCIIKKILFNPFNYLEWRRLQGTVWHWWWILKECHNYFITCTIHCIVLLFSFIWSFVLSNFL